MDKSPELDPTKDGFDHINIYSKAATWLGREASNFARSRIDVPDHGAFESIEGYWYWLLSGCERLRALSGVEAKTVGRQAIKQTPKPRPENFEDLIKIAIREKVKQNPGLQRALRDSTLPFTHYYVMSDRKTGIRRVIDANNHPWLLHEWECIRADLRGEPKPIQKELHDQDSEPKQDDQYDLF